MKLALSITFIKISGCYFIKISSVVVLILFLSLNTLDQFARYIYCSSTWFHPRVAGHEDIF